MRILAIETSCDETGAAVVEEGRRILSNVVASQAALHARFGGVYPEVASRQHVRTLYPVVHQALREAALRLAEVDALAVTRGPGLPGSLTVGVNFAKGLALATGLPLIGVHHLEAHIYAAWLRPEGRPDEPEPEFPLIALIVSGGHTELVYMPGHLRYRRLGGTRDDAAGEAFDKVARLLGLPYPGGPAIQKVAEQGNPRAFAFPRARLPNTWDFSFSGLKTAVLREVKKWQRKNQPLPVADLAASFQAAVVDVLVEKALAAVRAFQARSLIVAGGVAANRLLRERIQAESPVPVHIPPLSLCTDNAAMVAAAAERRLAAGQRDGLDFDVMPTWSLTEISLPEPQAEAAGPGDPTTETPARARGGD